MNPDVEKTESQLHSLITKYEPDRMSANQKYLFSKILSKSGQGSGECPSPDFQMIHKLTIRAVIREIID